MLVYIYMYTYLQHVLDAVIGVLGVDGHVGTPRLEDGQHGHIEGRGTFEKHAHDGPGLDPRVVGQVVRQLVGTALDNAVAQLVRLRGERAQDGQGRTEQGRGERRREGEKEAVRLLSRLELFFNYRPSDVMNRLCGCV